MSKTVSIGGLEFVIKADPSKGKKAINEVEQSAKKAATSTVNSVDDASKRINAIINDSTKTAKSKAASIAAIYRQQGNSMSESMRMAWSNINQGSAGANGLKKSVLGVNAAGKSMCSIFATAGKILVSAFAIRKVIQFGSECVKLGSDLAEVQNVVDVTFGSMSGKVNAFAKNAISSIGLSETVAKKYMGTYGAMAKAFGYSVGNAYEMSEALTNLTGDVASFYNLSTDEAHTKLKSVFTGETESLKELGVVMTQTALDAFALEKGFGKTTKSMTEQEKVALRLAFVQEKLSDASGDFARTSDGWANQTRVLALRFDALKASIGQGLINALTPVVRMLNVLMSYLQKAADAFANFTAVVFGKQKAASSAAAVASQIAGNVEDIGTAATNTAKATKKALGGLASFDKLNVIGSSSSSDDSGVSSPSSIGTAGSDKTAQATTEVEKSLTSGIPIVDKFVTKLKGLWEAFTGFASAVYNTVVPALVTFYKNGISPIVQWLGEKLANAISFVTELFRDWGQWFTDNKESINSFSALLGDVVAGIWSLIEPLADLAWETFKSVIKAISDIFQAFFQWILDNQTGVVTALTAITAGLLAYKAAVGISSLIDKFKKAVIAATSAEKLMAVAQGALNAVMSLNPIALVIAAIVALVAAFAVLWNKSEAFRNFWIKLWNNIKTVMSNVATWIKNKLTSIGQWFSNLWSKIKGIFKGSSGLSVGVNYSMYGEGAVVPKLASGGYVEANTPQLAMIGDNRHEGEIVAPESKITEAVLAALGPIVDTLKQLGATIQALRSGNGQNIIVQCILDGKIVYETVVKQNTAARRMRGGLGPLD